MFNFDPSGTMYGPVPELLLETGCGVYFFTLLDMFEMLEYLILKKPQFPSFNIDSNVKWMKQYKDWYSLLVFLLG